MKIKTKQEFQEDLYLPNRIDCFDEFILSLSQDNLKKLAREIHELQDSHDFLLKHGKEYVIVEVVFNEEDCIDMWLHFPDEYIKIVGRDKYNDMVVEFEDDDRM